MEDILTQACHRLRRHDETLTLLNLSCRGVGSEGVTKMVDACRRRHLAGDHCNPNARVKTVQLPVGGHTASVSEAATSEPSSLPPPPPSSSLVALWLEGNEIYSSGAKALRRLLAMSPRLKYLYLSNNHIGDAGMNALAPLALRQLDVCHLGDNDIGPLGALALAETLSGGKTKVSTVAEAEGDSMISHAAAMATPATTAPVTALDVEDVVTLHAKPTIKTLILDNNRLGDDGAKTLANALRYNPNLKHLDLRYNKIGMGALCTFRDVLKNKENTTLEHLCFEEIDDKVPLDGITCIRRPPRRRNRTISRVMERRTCPCAKCGLSYEIDYYLALNRSGRRGFGDVTVPVGCWPRILARVTDDEPCLLYTMLTIRPDIPTEGRVRVEPELLQLLDLCPFKDS